MRALREDERDEIESVKHFIKYINSNKNAEGAELWYALLKLREISEKYVIAEIVTDEEMQELLDMDDLKELLERFFSKLKVEEENKINEEE